MRKPVRAVPTAPGEPAWIARGAPRGAEGRVLEEGQPKPQSGNANSSPRPGPSRKGNGSPSVSLTLIHQPAHSLGGPRVGESKVRARQGLKETRHAARPVRLPAPAAPLGPPQSACLYPRREASLPPCKAPPSFPSAIFELTPRAWTSFD